LFLPLKSVVKNAMVQSKDYNIDVKDYTVTLISAALKDLKTFSRVTRHHTE
jgi:hypothetical protein